MATNDFLPFAYGGGANVLSQSAYAALTSLLSGGFQSGVAQSNQVNKTLRQSSIMSAVLAQFAADYSGNNSTDDGTTATLEANLVAAIRGATKTTVTLTDTGTANAYAAANTPPLVAGTWVNNVVQQVKILNANTGASTYAPDGLAAIPIYGLGLQPLQGGELYAGGTAILMKQTITGVNSGNPICVLLECSGGAQQVGAGSYLTSSPAQFDNSTKLSTTAFMQRALGNAQSTNSISASTTLTAANAGMLNGLFGSGGYTITLPAANSVRSGSTFWFMATTAVTIARAGTDGITLSGTFNAQASVAMKSGDTLGLVSDGTGAWFGISGSAMLQYADGPFGASKATSGYQKLPSGVIIQWGTGGYSGTSGGTGQWSYPIAFPNGTFAVVGTVGSALGQNALGFQAYSNSQMTIGYYNASGAAASGVGFSWMAIGY